MQLTIINHHHHQHLFLKRPFLPRSARARRSSRYEASPHIPEQQYPFRVQTQLIYTILLHTFSPSLPAPTSTSHPCHHQISTGGHSIISTHTVIRSTCPNHLNQLFRKHPFIPCWSDVCTIYSEYMDKMEVLLKIGRLPYAIKKQLSIPMNNFGRR